MNKNVALIIIVVIVILGGGTALLVANRNSGSTTPPTSTTSNTPKTMDMTTQPNPKTPATTSSVTIDNFAFSPSNITVKKGTAVTWTNKDSATHTVTSTSGPKSFDSGDLANGKSFSFTFTIAGTYKYKCSIHPNMTGTVIVTE